MSNSMFTPDEFALPLPITQGARQTAEQFARQQPTPEKAEQVRLNTLAICAVNDYLQLMEIPTDPTASDSWNPIVRMCANVSDLEVPGLGRLECRPVVETALPCQVPPEVWQDRIGYVVVQIDEASDQATVLGFAPTAETEELPLNELQSPEALLDHLHALRYPVTEVAPAPQPVPVPSVGETLVNLSRWFQNTFESGWQAIDELLNPPELSPAFAFRRAPAVPSDAATTVRRGKLINLGIQFNTLPVVLLVDLTTRIDGYTTIVMQVHPNRDKFLPPDLILRVLDESNAIFLEATSRDADNYIQLEFSGMPGEQFKVQVSLGLACATEAFVI